MSETTAPDGAIVRVWARSVTPETPHGVQGGSVQNDNLSDDDIADAYSVLDRAVPWLRVNFVSSLDGAATVKGLSGGLSDAADHRVFDVLRRSCDVVIVGAGTARAEGYGPMRLDDRQISWRRAHGLADHPPFALVSAALGLDPADRIFAHAPVRPIVVTTQKAPEDRKKALAEVADVLECGELTVDPRLMRDALAKRGLSQQHCEGGPHLFGSLIAADAVDELCLTESPKIVAGSGPRISGGDAPELPVALSLEHILRSGSTLLLRYVRDQGQAASAAIE